MKSNSDACVIAFITLAVISQSGNVAKCDAQPIVPTIENIEAAWRARETFLRTVQFDYQETEFIRAMSIPATRPSSSQSIDFVPDKDLTISRSVSYAVSGGMIHYSYDGDFFEPEHDGVRRKKYVSVFDGTVALNFHGLTIRNDESFPASGFIAKEAIHYDANNRYLAALAMFSRPCDVTAGGIDLRNYQISIQTGIINGRTIVIIEPTNFQTWENLTFWLDPGRSFIVLKIVSKIGSRGAEPHYTVDVSYAKHAAVEWVPSEWKLIVTNGSADVVSRQTIDKVTNVEINNDIPESKFKFDFPAGTAVVDNRVAERFVVRKNKEKRTVTVGELRRGVSYRELMETATGETGRITPSRRSVWLIFANIGLVVLLVLGVALRRRNLKRMQE